MEGVKIGGGNFAVIAGPCSIESEEQITYCAQRVKAAGASLLRGGAFKPRTSPYSFQGMRSEGLDLLKLARRATGSPIVTEIMNTEHLPLFENVDLIQVGARNMQNFELLKAVGRQKKPVLLKRGLANTLEEFVMSAEYIMAEGNENVILCERGIRTFETSMRNTLDLAGVVMLHKMTHLPVVVDPSHACGHAWMVPELAKAAVAAGADGLMIEVHNNPAKAKCDGAQSLTPDQFDELMQFIGKEVEFFGKKNELSPPERILLYAGTAVPTGFSSPFFAGKFAKPEAFPRSGEGGCARSKQTDEDAGKQHFTLNTPDFCAPAGFHFLFTGFMVYYSVF